MWGLRGGSEGGEVNPPRFRTRMGIRGNGSYPTPHMMPYSTTTRKHRFFPKIQPQAETFDSLEHPNSTFLKTEYHGCAKSDGSPGSDRPNSSEEPPIATPQSTYKNSFDVSNSFA